MFAAILFMLKVYFYIYDLFNLSAQFEVHHSPLNAVLYSVSVLQITAELPQCYSDRGFRATIVNRT